MNAVTSCDMAMSGIRSRIPPDGRVIDAMHSVGRALPEDLRETGQSDLAGDADRHRFERKCTADRRNPKAGNFLIHTKIQIVALQFDEQIGVITTNGLIDVIDQNREILVYHLEAESLRERTIYIMMPTTIGRS